MRKPKAPTIVDVQVDRSGSLFLFDLKSNAAKTWVKDHVSEECTFWGGALVVEHGYAMDVANGMMGDGLIVK